MSITYTVSITDADAHLIDVQLRLSSPDPAGQKLQLPNWIPGSYMIRDFSRNIVSIDATSESQAVRLSKLDKSTWQAESGLSELVVKYRVYAWDLSVRAAHVDRTHAFFNGTSIFLCALGQEADKHAVTFLRPTHDQEQQFELATTLPVKQTDSGGFGEYQAANYDELIDHPVEQGTFKRLSFLACGVVHDVIFTGDCRFDEQRVADDLKAICEYEIGFFGEPAPLDKYLFMVMVVDTGYGGLEHRTSTALMISRDNLPLVGETEISDKYLDFLGLCSHEYFHNWNVKRIKPARFIPFELQQESYTELLWFFEGMTSYYDDLILVRCGLIDEARYLGLLSKTLTRVQRGAGRLNQSVTDSSLDAWNKFYKQDENAPNAIVSYYAKGALIALCIDSLMRSHTQQNLSLDAVMLRLWEQWQDTGRGLAEDEPQRLVAQLLDTDVSDFFHRVLYSTDELPLQESLQQLGVTLEWVVRTSSTDVGGSRPAKPVATDPLPWLGAQFADADGGIRITHVMNKGPAERAGLAAGDKLIAIDHQSVSKSELDWHLNRLRTSGEAVIHYFRLGKLYQSALSIELPPADTAVLAVADAAKVAQWLTPDISVNS